MSKKTKLAKILALLIIPTTIILLVHLNYSNINNQPIIAKVNGQEIYQDEMEMRLKEMFNDTSATNIQINKLPKEIVEVLAKDIFVQKQLDIQIKKSNFTKNAQTKKKIKNYTQKIIRQEYIKSLIEQKVTNEKIQNKYVELANELSGKKELRLQHILVQSKTAANIIKKKLAAKQKFETLAQKYSVDKSTNRKGGNLEDYIAEDTLPENIQKSIANLKKGEISKPVKTDYGWHVFKIADIRSVTAEPFDSAKDKIKKQLEKDEIQKIFLNISNSAKVKILINLQEVREFENNAQNIQTLQE